VCVCVREREKEREREILRIAGTLTLYLYYKSKLELFKVHFSYFSTKNKIVTCKTSAPERLYIVAYSIVIHIKCHTKFSF